ncbi:phage tail spike protein [Streptococcus suis]|uniref:phage tail spike protein n=1 Tax=Streptococcus suis TaxID=1307 RepID=UPI002FC98224
MIYLKDGNIPLNLAYDDDIVQEANSTYQLSFKFPLTDGKWNLLKREVFLLADDLHGEQEFFIFEVKKVNGYVQVYAKQVATLLNYYSINTISVDRVPGQTAMTALAGSIKRNCPFTFFSDIMDRHTFNESNVSVMDALAKDKHSIVGQWGGDLVRDKYQVKLLKNGGIENESLFMYKKNLSSYEESENINNLKTRLHLKKTIQGQSEGEADRVIAVTVDSPLISQYRQIYEADIEVNDQDVIDEASLLAYGKRYFSSTLCDLVENSINLDVKGKSDVSVKMFDTVSVFHERFDVDLRLKITSYHFGPMSKRLKSIGFGKVSQTFGSTVAGMVAGSVDKATNTLSASFEQKLQKEIDNANRHFDAEFDKRVEVINNSIEQSKAEAERYADQIKTEISQEFDAFEQEYQVTKQSQSQQIADILAKAQANTILATDAKNIGNQAKADAANALSKAIQYKNEAIAEATRLDTVERQATETKLATAKSQAISEATRLVETAKSLLSGQISNISTDLSQTKEAIKLLATKATVDTLTGRVSSAEAMIQVQADQISQRVKTSDFDQAKQRISTAESSIIQIGNRITTEISETVAKIPTEIGGRNYFRGYKYNEEITLNSYQNVGSFTQFYNRLTYNLPESDGKTFTISFEAISPNGETPLEVYNRNQDPQYFNFPSRRIGTVGPTWQKFTRTVTVATQTVSNTTNSNRIEIYAPNKTGVRVRNIKVELGNIATDWSPAPEDVVTEIENVKTIITQTAEGQQQLSTRLTEIQGKVMTTETSIEQLVGDVSSKVSQTTFDNLKRTVDSQATSISQNQSDIALKAEKTYVDGVKATADSAKSTASDALTKANANADSIKTTQAELKVTSDAVKTKVTRTDFDKVDGRLRTAESTIVTQAGEIEKRLTSTQVETAISNKGYQTKADVDKNITDRGFATSTTVQNIVKETSEIFNRSISRVESSIPTDYDNQNLWIKSKSSGYSAIEKLPDNHISGQSECYRLNNGTQLIFNIEPEFSSRLYQKVTFSAWVKYNNVVRGSNAWNVFNCFKHVIYRKNSKTGVESSVAYTTPVAFEGTSDWKYISFTIDYSTQSQYDQLKTSLAFRMENAASGTAWVTGVKVELGSKATRYNLAVEDTVTVTSFNSVSDTVSSHTQTLSEQGKSISQVIQIAQGLVTRIDNLSVGGRNLFKGYKYNEEITLNNYQGVGSFTQFYNRLTYNLPDAGGKEFTISFEAISPNGDTPINVYNDNGAPQYFRFPGQILGTAGATWQKFTRTVTVATQTVSNTTNSNRIEIYAPNKTGVRVRNIKVELGNIATDWSPAPEDNDSAVQAVSTQVNTLAGSWSVQNLNSSGDILSQANLSSAQFFLEAAKIRLKGKTLADEIQAIDGKFKTLFVADGTFAKLNATVIGSQAITADKLKVDQAFFDKLMANDAYLRQLFAKSVFTTQVQAVAVSAKQIAGGIAKALNGGMDVNFDESKINFYTNVAAIRRIYTGHPTQFIKFETEGNYSRTIIGSNRNGGEAFNSATFAGIVVENTNNINTEDSVKIYGDNTLLRHAQGDVGWNINSVTQRIVPANINAESEIWSKHFVAPDKNSKPVRLDTAVAALWDIWNHIIYNNFEFNEALRTHIKARRDNWKFELNL